MCAFLERSLSESTHADSQELQFINGTPSRILLVIEPRSSEYWIESSATVRALVRGTSITPKLDVEYLAGGLVMYAGGRGQVEVYQMAVAWPNTSVRGIRRRN
ncbi:hypothetical protein EMIT0232MI5_30086 [Pseudomonas sp. IT-232MI5]